MSFHQISKIGFAVHQVKKHNFWVKHASANITFLENFYHDYDKKKTNIILEVQNLNQVVIKLQQISKSS